VLPRRYGGKRTCCLHGPVKPRDETEKGGWLGRSPPGGMERRGLFGIGGGVKIFL